MKKVLIGLIFAAIFYEGANASQKIDYDEIIRRKMQKQFDDPTKLVITSDLLNNLKLEEGDYSHLTKLKIKGNIRDKQNFLSQVSILLSKAQNLEKLQIIECKLGDFPENIRDLKKLKKLRLEHNEISVLPDFIGDLSQLEELTIEWNKLTSVPKTIENLTKLKILDLQWNPISSLPETIGNLTQLTVLNLQGNLFGNKDYHEKRCS